MMIVKCMPSSVHETVPSCFVEQAVEMKIGLSRAAKREVQIGSTESTLSPPILPYLTRLAHILPGFKGFRDSNMNINSAKEADGFVKLESRRYPSIVVESGWSESFRDLKSDARLWLWGTDPPVEFVIVVEHVQNKTLRDDRSEERKEEILHLIGHKYGFGIEAAIIQPELQLVCANDAGNAVCHIDLLLQVVSQLAGKEYESRADRIGRRSSR